MWDSISDPFGFELNNSPQFVNNSYTIEMVINITGGGSVARLVGFNDLSGLSGDNGIYLNPGGDLEFFSTVNGSSTINRGTCFKW
ncbi:MAG: hypothetical protein WDO19_03420 [Bacteroidota bacterium]